MARAAAALAAPKKTPPPPPAPPPVLRIVKEPDLPPILHCPKRGSSLAAVRCVEFQDDLGCSCSGAADARKAAAQVTRDLAKYLPKPKPPVELFSCIDCKQPRARKETEPCKWCRVRDRVRALRARQPVDKACAGCFVPNVVRNYGELCKLCVRRSQGKFFPTQKKKKKP